MFSAGVVEAAMVELIAKPPSSADHGRDFYAWTQQQATALRATTRIGANLPVDWENVAVAAKNRKRRN